MVILADLCHLILCGDSTSVLQVQGTEILNTGSYYVPVLDDTLCRMTQIVDDKRLCMSLITKKQENSGITMY